MPLSWNEIRSRSLAFSKEWEGESSESAEAKSFWDAFFNIFGITRRRIASFEVPVKKGDGQGGFIDLLWKGILLVEHKSKGKNLDRAYGQALDYFSGLKERDLPQYVLVSDFSRFRLYDLDNSQIHEFNIEDLYKNIRLFGFIAGYQVTLFSEEDPVNIKAAESLGRLHDQLSDNEYKGHALEIFLVRLLFCMFAEDTGIFERKIFQDYIENRTHEDGTDLGMHLSVLFQVLDREQNKRQKNLDEQLQSFPYINGKLFEEQMPVPAFNSNMRETLLNCCALDWSRISPAIFGSLFQSIMDKDKRRNLGAHYTSEANILKLLRPLFINDLYSEFNSLKSTPKRLIKFHVKLSRIKIMDPACGCGNFLVIAYRELRLLELEVLRVLYKKRESGFLNIEDLILLDVDQFYGIELEEFPAQIAQVALWLTDHQMNLKVSEEFGQYFVRLPLSKTPNIFFGNALKYKWEEIIEPIDLSYIVGNPPFIGKGLQSITQKEDMKHVIKDKKRASLDYVCAWYIKAIQLCKINPTISCAFVSTNSIVQGEQASILWPIMLDYGTKINFAHRTFSWTNEARSKAAVHCVIIGFALIEKKDKYLYEYENIKSHPHEIKVTNINPYLVEASDVVLKNRRTPICNVTPMLYGSKPADGGNLLLNEDEKEELLRDEPQAKPWIKRFLNADEFLNNKDRYCLWLQDCPPEQLNRMPKVKERINKVKAMRRESTKKATQELAATPALFAEVRQSQNEYLLVPRHSSENRLYVPIGYFSKDVICGDANFSIPNATRYDFAIFTSLMHMAWMRTVCGRIKSDYRYSANIVYNNFPWPLNVTNKQKDAINVNAQAILDARALFPEASLSELYNPTTMPKELTRAHKDLDRAVDNAYGRTKYKSEAERVAFLFELYEQYTKKLNININ